MRSPFTTPNNQLSHPKPINTNTTTTTTTFHTSINNNHLSYEPTSVLELRRSPSPVLGGSDSVNNFAAISGVSDDSSLQWDEHAVLAPTHSQPLSLEDWDSMMLGLGEKDDSTLPFKTNNPQFSSFEPSLPIRNLESFDPSFSFNDFSQNQNFNPSSNQFEFQTLQNTNNNHLNIDSECLQLDQLVRAASLVESDDLQGAQTILSRLSHQLPTPIGKPLRRSIYYFKEALQSLLSGANLIENNLSPSEMVQKIKAYKSFSELSPITMFTNCTANQTLLEALNTVMFVHIIDFEIGIGGQWASFMQEIACKARSESGVLPSLRITAIVSDESSIEAGLIRENLQQFAQELGIHFQLDFVLFSTFEEVLFGSIRLMNGEYIAVNLSPRIFRHLRTSENISRFLHFLRRITPRITLFMDFEGSRDGRSGSFRRNFLNGIEFYSLVLESLDEASNGDGEMVRKIEKYLLRPKMFASVYGGGNCVLPWKEMFTSVGMAPIQFSEFTDTQAEWISRRAQVPGFRVARRQGAMLLCWHEKELVAISAWRC